MFTKCIVYMHTTAELKLGFLVIHFNTTYTSLPRSFTCNGKQRISPTTSHGLGLHWPTTIIPRILSSSWVPAWGSGCKETWQVSQSSLPHRLQNLFIPWSLQHWKTTQTWKIQLKSFTNVNAVFNPWHAVELQKRCQ